MSKDIEHLKIAGYEGGSPPQKISYSTPALITDKYLINPVLKSRGPLARFDEYVKDYSIVPIRPRDLDKSYVDNDLVLLIVSHSLKVSILPPTDYIDCWHDNDYMYVLYATNKDFKRYVSRAIFQLAYFARLEWGSVEADAMIDTGLILDFSDPIMNALHVKTAAPDKRNTYERLARSCLRGRVDEFEEELKRSPVNTFDTEKKS